MKANDLECKSISLPAVSSGTYGFPKPLCAEVFYLATKEFVCDMIDEDQEKKLHLKKVRFVNIEKETNEIFQKEFGNHFTTPEEKPKKSK